MLVLELEVGEGQAAAVRRPEWPAHHDRILEAAGKGCIFASKERQALYSDVFILQFCPKL